MLQLMNKKPDILDKNYRLLQRVVDPSEVIFVMGINDYCAHVTEVLRAAGVQIAGIIDDYTDLTEHSKVRIVRTVEVPKDAVVISCVIDGRLITAIEQLRVHGIYNIITYLELRLRYPEWFREPRFCEQNVSDIDQHSEEYQWLYSILEDDLSKETLQHVTDFRYNFNVESMRYFSFQLHKQYFESFTVAQEDEIFVDCGGFDGHTTKAFIASCPEYKKVYYFEPSPQQYDLSKRNLSGYRDISYHNAATYSSNTTLKFNAEMGSSSGISAGGGIDIRAVKLDDVIVDKVTYIKLDVEGAEMDTLRGAEQIIRTARPKLAVCVYHKQEDFWKVPQLVLSYNPGYKVYLRHYTEGLLETVMYFV